MQVIKEWKFSKKYDVIKILHNNSRKEIILEVCMLDVDYMRIAISEAKISDKMGEVPVGAVITNAEGQIIAQGHNLRRLCHNKWLIFDEK